MEPKLEDQISNIASVVVPTMEPQSSSARGGGGSSHENLLCTACGCDMKHSTLGVGTSRKPHRSDPEVCHVCGLLIDGLPDNPSNAVNEITPPRPSTEGWLELVGTAVRLQAATSKIKIKDCLISWAHSSPRGSTGTGLPPPHAFSCGGVKGEQVPPSDVRRIQRQR